MLRTEDEIQQELDAINEKISEIVSGAAPNIKAGGVSVDVTGLLRELRNQKNDLEEELKRIPYEGHTSIQFEDET